MEEEIWKEIKGFEGYYAVSNLGQDKKHCTYTAQWTQMSRKNTVDTTK